jgi:NADPH:quinone reductase-like Zn-dependent oxidoreductase
MKAVLLINHGGPEMLRYSEAPDPTAPLRGGVGR